MDHWDELQGRAPVMPVTDNSLVIYGTKTFGPCVQLEGELTRGGISFEKRDLSKDDDMRELTEKLARVGKMSGHFSMPVAEVNGVLVEGASMGEITRRLR